MLTVSIRSMQISKNEQAAKEKLIKILERDFNIKIVANTVLKEGSYNEYIKLYEVYNPKKSNPRYAGRKATGKTDIICDFALNNPENSISQIAEHFGCSRQYISRVLKENKVSEAYKEKHKWF
jgi:hypothetical protein